MTHRKQNATEVSDDEIFQWLPWCTFIFKNQQHLVCSTSQEVVDVDGADT